MAMRGTTVSLIGLAGLAAVLGGAGCLESSGDEPINPTYSRQIKPLIEAHCIRCHGAGGTLNADPDSQPVMMVQGPTQGDFTTLASPAMGRNGLMFYTGAGAAVMIAHVTQDPMPPPPAPALTSWEFDTLVKWVNNPLP
jgi:mono/diheme cytochrome c family protein